MQNKIHPTNPKVTKIVPNINFNISIFDGKIAGSIKLPQACSIKYIYTVTETHTTNVNNTGRVSKINVIDPNDKKNAINAETIGRYLYVIEVFMRFS